MIYRSYVIRCWEEPIDSRQETAVSRYILEIPETSERQGFTDVDQLLQAIRQILHPQQTEQLTQEVLSK